MTGDSGFGLQSLYRAVSSTTSTTPSSVGLPSPPADDVPLQALCTRATILGNSISVRLVDLLASVKNRPAGIHKLASEFLGISRILWCIESGLAKADRRPSNESTHTSWDWEPSGASVRASMLSPGAADGLDARLRQTVRDFETLDRLLGKFLEAGRKGTVARLQSRWRKMFADRDLDRIKGSLASAKESLRMSALVLRCASPHDPMDAATGVGYGGLAAAMDSPIKKRPGPGARAKTLDTESFKKRRGSRSIRSSVEELPATRSEGDKSDPLTTRSSPDGSRASSCAPPAERASRPPVPHSVSDCPVFHAASDEVDSQPKLAATPKSTASDGPSDQRRPSLSNQATSFASSLSEAGPWMDEMKSLDVSSAGDLHPRIEADPESMPRWAAHEEEGGNAEALKTTLASALGARNYRVVEQVLDKGMSPDTTDPHLVRQAVLNHDAEGLLLLLLFGADANRPDTDGVTPLCSAVHVGFSEGAQVLLKYGADPNLRASGGGAPLDLAVSQGDWDLTQVLLVYGADPNTHSAGYTVPLVEAVCDSGPDSLVGLLLDYRADPDAKDDGGLTPLCKAVAADRADMARCLLEHGADPNLPGPEHVLWRAARRPDCLRLLLSRGADHRLAPGVLELATSINSPEAARAFLDAGVDPNVRRDGIYSPLGTAVRDGRDELLRILLEAGADPNAGAGELPLATCVAKGRNQMLPPLVRAGAEIWRVRGILERAAAAGNVLGMAWLLRHGADPNERSAAGETPLTRSIRENLPGAVDILLSFGADADAKGREWPVEMAVGKPALLRKIVGWVDLGRYEGLVARAEGEGEEESARILREAGAV